MSKQHQQHGSRNSTIFYFYRNYRRNRATEATNSSPTQKRVSIIVNLLYGLTILSVGVTGFFLPINLVPECNSSSSSSSAKWIWKTNTTKLPNQAIKNWASKSNGEYDNDSDQGATVGYVESTGITLFKGTNYSTPQSSDHLWTVGDHHKPIEHTDFVYPDPFLTVTSNRVCFQITDYTKYEQGPKIYCSDGKTFQAASIVDPIKRRRQYTKPPYRKFQSR